MISGSTIGSLEPKARSGIAILLCLGAAFCFGLLTAIAGGVISAVLLVSLVVAGATVRNYRFGLWFLVFLLPLSASAIFPREILGITGANPYNALLALTLLSFAIHRMWQRKAGWNIAYPRFWWAFLAPIVIAAIVGLQHLSEIPSFAFTQPMLRFTGAGGYLRDVLVKPLLYILLAFLLGHAARDGMKPGSLVTALCLSIWIFAAWVFAYVLLNGIGLSQLAGASSRESLSGTGMHANDLGVLAASVLTLMIFAINSSTKTSAQRFLYIVTAIISGALLLVSFSRGAFLAFAIGLTVFFIVQGRLKILVFGLFVILLMLPLLPTELYQRLSTGVDTGGSMVLHSSEDPLTAGRVAGVWMPLLGEVAVHPFFGNGLMAIAWSLPFRSGALGLLTLNPHNLYLKMLLEVGMAGMLLVLLFYVDFWRRCRASARNAAVPQELAWLFGGAAAALLGYAAYGLSGGDYLPDPSNAWLWVVWGLLLAASSEPAMAMRKRARWRRSGASDDARAGI